MNFCRDMIRYYSKKQKGLMTSMSEKEQIIYMQTRILRLASEEWNKPIETVTKLFAEHGVLPYIEHCFDMFHLEGDDAILKDIEAYLDKRGDSN